MIGAGADDENGKKESGAEKETNGDRKEEEEKKGVELAKPEPVIVTKHTVTMETLKAALEKHQSESESLTMHDDDVVILEDLPDFDMTQVEPALKKVRLWAEKTNFKKLQTSDRPSPAAGFNFGPFSPPQSHSSSGLRLKIIGTKPPKPNRLLEPPHVTILLPRDRHRPAREDMDVDDRMGPPRPKVSITTPYETVKNALTILKNEFGITTLPPEQKHGQDQRPEYPLNDRIAPYCTDLVDEVVMELNSMPETVSSEQMKEWLLAFQTRLGLPRWPLFYNLLWKSPADFTHHLVQQGFRFDDVNDASGGNAIAVNDGRSTGDDGGEVVDKNMDYFSVGAWEWDGGPYDFLPPPAISWYDAIGILYEFTRIGDDREELNEEAFLTLERDLQLPPWVGVEPHELFLFESMQRVLDYLHDYFKTSHIWTPPPH